MNKLMQHSETSLPFDHSFACVLNRTAAVRSGTEIGQWPCLTVLNTSIKDNGGIQPCNFEAILHDQVDFSL